MNALFLIVLFIVLGIVLLTVKAKNSIYPINFKKFGYISLGLAVLTLLSASFTIIEPGFVGVPVTFGNVGSQSLPAGIHPIFF